MFNHRVRDAYLLDRGTSVFHPARCATTASSDVTDLLSFARRILGAVVPQRGCRKYRLRK
ncbi:MAG: hypothetical protein EOO77_38060 [Oxalobacteraceae bacterium]|nr:MAG: hypothetical protein EOO77_38060 [Oxalobacteraceae bacterium]